MAGALHYKHRPVECKPNFMVMSVSDPTNPDPLFVLRGFKSTVSSIAFINYRRNDCLLTGTDDGVITIWDLRTRRPLVSQNCHQHKIIWLFSSTTLNVNLDVLFISQSKDGFVHLNKETNDSTQLSVCKSYQISNFSFASSDLLYIDGSHLLCAPSSSGHENIDIINLESEELIEILKSDNQGMVMAIKLKAHFADKNQFFLLAGFESGHLNLWTINFESRKLKMIFNRNVIVSKDMVTCLEFDPQKRHGFCGSTTHELSKFALDDNDELVLTSRRKISNPGTSCTVIRPDGKIVVFGGWDGRIRVFSNKTFKPLAVIDIHKKGIESITFTKGPIELIKEHSYIFAVCSRDQTVSLWSIY